MSHSGILDKVFTILTIMILTALEASGVDGPKPILGWDAESTPSVTIAF